MSSWSQTKLFQQDLPRVLCVALAIPLVIWLINQIIMPTDLIHTWQWQRSRYALWVVDLIFVAEVATVAWCSGRHLHHPLLRWVVFLWCIAFIDLMFVLIHWHSPQDLPARKRGRVNVRSYPLAGASCW
jgi:hypothetical protein